MVMLADRSSDQNGDGLVGRAEELELITSFLERAVIAGGVLLVAGEPGIGKTALLNSAAEDARGSGSRVLRVEGVEFEASLAFSGLNQLLMPLVGEFDELAELHRDALTSALGLGNGSTPDRLVVSTAALALLRQTAESRPLLLVADDVHWLDRSSGQVLSFVARRLAGSRVGLLVAARAGIGSFFDGGGLPILELGPLDEMAASVLLQSRFPMLAPRARARVLDDSQGNPLALLELPGALGGRQGIARLTVPAVLPLTKRLQALFASRVGEQSAATRRLLLLAVLDGTGELDVLRSASGDLHLEGLVAAHRAGLIEVEEGSCRIVFRHPLTRSGVVALSTPDERRSAHLTLADALLEQPERRAWHLAEATGEPDEEVAGLIETVAQRILRRGDRVGAVAALIRAAELSPRPADRGRRLTRAANVGRVNGDLRDVSRLLEEAQRADPQCSESLEAAVAASHVLLTDQGDVDTAHRLLVGAIKLRTDRSDTVDSVLADALQMLLYLCWFGGRDELWKPLEDAISRLEPNIPEVLRLCSAFYADPARVSLPALARLDVAIGALHELVDPADVARIVDAAIFVDRLGGCRETLWRVLKDGRAGIGNISLHTALIALAIDDYMIGQWEEADELLDELLQLFQDLGYHMVWPVHHVKALLAAARGDVEATWTLTQEMSRWAEPRGMHAVRWYCCHARTLAALAQGDFEYAYLQAAAISPPGTFAPHVPHAVWVAMDLVEAAVHTNRHAEAAAHANAMREQGIAALSPRLALLAGASAALTAADDQTAQSFEEALALPGIDRWPFDRARVQLAYGARLRRTGARIEARKYLSAALDTFQWLGARPWAARTADELRATGRTSNRGRAWHPAQLTPQQHQIAMLAAAGMTNKEIGERLALSHRTVATHLHRIFPKLGIATRSALRDALGPGRSTGID